MGSGGCGAGWKEMRLKKSSVAGAHRFVCGQALDHLEVDTCLLTFSWLVPGSLFLLSPFLVLMFSDYQNMLNTISLFLLLASEMSFAPMYALCPPVSLVPIRC